MTQFDFRSQDFFDGVFVIWVFVPVGLQVEPFQVLRDQRCQFFSQSPNFFNAGFVDVRKSQIQRRRKAICPVFSAASRAFVVARTIDQSTNPCRSDGGKTSLVQVVHRFRRKHFRRGLPCQSAVATWVTALPIEATEKI